MLGVNKKAATNMRTIITNNSEHQDLVKDLLALAKEEMIILSRYTILLSVVKIRRERKDYVNELYSYMKKTEMEVEFQFSGTVAFFGDD
jgi:tRNA-(ms[2]io[6]A)-hydroxylase